jgi:hypothetical protein
MCGAAAFSASVVLVVIIERLLRDRWRPARNIQFKVEAMGAAIPTRI